MQVIFELFLQKSIHMDHFPSRLLENAVTEISRLPGIGKRTALRIALFLLKQKPTYANDLGKAIINLREGINYCRQCHNISDDDLCEICKSPKRNQQQICVVEDIRDVMAVEGTGEYFGVYHVLGGIINPMEGIGPHDLNMESLLEKVKNNEISEVILALPSTIEGDTTNFYIYKNLKEFQISITTIARGISIGDELEYADEVTLGRSILYRTPYEKITK